MIPEDGFYLSKKAAVFQDGYGGSDVYDWPSGDTVTKINNTSVPNDNFCPVKKGDVITLYLPTSNCHLDWGVPAPKGDFYPLRK